MLSALTFRDIIVTETFVLGINYAFFCKLKTINVIVHSGNVVISLLFPITFLCIDLAFLLSKYYVLVSELIYILDNEPCTNIRTLALQDYYSRDIYPWYDFYFSWIDWYNSTFWGGYHLIAWRDQIPTHCWNSYSRDNILVLSGILQNLIIVYKCLHVLYCTKSAKHQPFDHLFLTSW